MAQPIRMVDNANITEIFKHATNEKNALEMTTVYFHLRWEEDIPELALAKALSWKTPGKLNGIPTPPPLDQPAKTAKVKSIPARSIE